MAAMEARELHKAESNVQSTPATSHTTLRVDRQLHALQLAKDCAALGARVRTIHHLTGLQQPELLRLLFPDRGRVPRGRAPDSPEWYHGTNLIYRCEASIVIALYRRLCCGGFDAAEALVAAYRHYAGICEPPPRISFDRAFDLAAHLDAHWITCTRSFSLVTCPACGSEYLATIGAAPRTGDDCAFCKLVHRYATDQRVQGAFPLRPLPEISPGELGVRQLLRG